MDSPSGAFTFRAARSPADAAAAYEIIDAAARRMLHESGLMHWLYPFKNVTLIERLATSPSSVVLLAFDGTCDGVAAPLATVTLSCVPLSTYVDPATWHDRDAPAAYIGNLAVSPTASRRGVGSAIMSAACDVARSQYNAQFMRLDAITENAALAGFYSKLGFEMRGHPAPHTHPNRFALSAVVNSIAGPPNTEPYVLRTPNSSSTFTVHCQCWEMKL